MARGPGRLDRLYKESHQVVDRWPVPADHQVGVTPMLPESAPELARKAFKQAESERPGATLVAVPEDLAPRTVSAEPLPVRQPRDAAPSTEQVARAVDLLNGGQAPVVLVGAGQAAIAVRGPYSALPSV